MLNWTPQIHKAKLYWNNRLFDYTHMRSIIVILLVALIGLQYKLWLGEGSISQWRQLDNKIAEKTVENEQLLARNHAIEADILELKSGEQALEEQARFELGMVKDDEVYYQFIE